MAGQTTPSTQGNKLVHWLKKLGFWGFIFFLLKGLLWLLLPWLAAQGLLQLA